MPDSINDVSNYSASRLVLGLLYTRPKHYDVLKHSLDASVTSFKVSPRILGRGGRDKRKATKARRQFRERTSA